MTRLAFAQRRHLADTLAERGISLNCVVIADDENLDIAREYGFDTIELPNRLAHRVNEGFNYACRQGADFATYIGSDDWLHEDLFTDLLEHSDEGVIVAGRILFFVNLRTGRAHRTWVKSRWGAVPWFIPKATLIRHKFRPILGQHEDLMRSIDGAIAKGMRDRTPFIFTDPHDLCRIDFKSTVNLTPYDGLVQAIGIGSEEPDPWSLLAERFPQHLVDRARQLSAQFQAEERPLDPQLRPLSKACSARGIDLIVEPQP